VTVVALPLARLEPAVMRALFEPFEEGAFAIPRRDIHQPRLRGVRRQRRHVQNRRMRARQKIHFLAHEHERTILGCKIMLPKDKTLTGYQITGTADVDSEGRGFV
jgi:hypothetical protein